MIILPILEWFISNYNYVSQFFLLLFAFSLLFMLIRGRSS